MHMIQIIYMNCGYRIEVKVMLAGVEQLKQLQRKPRKTKYKASPNITFTSILYLQFSIIYIIYTSSQLQIYFQYVPQVTCT